ncbi:TFIIH C1-like domain containing protein [Trema orientale]|uniref:TFIIH C1-like domain containing protein n=1 Tax=Trema orientale TaxID=63057 RepID=A0A2P5BW13_TREOI|nr:TFIIH C1-like domain containing protein [Trema orientale]
MEFWGLEVKSGEPAVVEHEHGTILHLSQACLDETKKEKGSEPVLLFAKVGDQKFVIGTLSWGKFPQISFDLAFGKKFELSHNWENGSVHFTGYVVLPSVYAFNDNSDSDTDSEDEKQPIPVDHGNSYLQAKEEVKVTDSNKGVKSGQSGSSGNDEKDSLSSDESGDEPQAKVNDEEDSTDDDFENEEEDGSDDEESDDSEEEDEDEEKKVDIGKKRSAESAKKTPVAEKKAKLVTPEKIDPKTSGSKVGGHTATPHPAKQAKKQQTPKSGGAFSCKMCNRSFGSDIALQSHTRAKHATAKPT